MIAFGAAAVSAHRRRSHCVGPEVGADETLWEALPSNTQSSSWLCSSATHAPGPRVRDRTTNDATSGGGVTVTVVVIDASAVGRGEPHRDGRSHGGGLDEEGDTAGSCSDGDARGHPLQSSGRRSAAPPARPRQAAAASVTVACGCPCPLDRRRRDRERAARPGAARRRRRGEGEGAGDGEGVGDRVSDGDVGGEVLPHWATAHVNTPSARTASTSMSDIVGERLAEGGM